MAYHFNFLLGNAYFLPNRNETTATTITAPTIDGIIAIPANEGPQLPRSDCPTDEPIRPAKIFAINPIEPPFLVIAPAMRPIRPPTIMDHNIVYPPFLFLNQRINFFDYTNYIVFQLGNIIVRLKFRTVNMYFRYK